MDLLWICFGFESCVKKRRTLDIWPNKWTLWNEKAL